MKMVVNKADPITFLSLPPFFNDGSSGARERRRAWKVRGILITSAVRTGVGGDR